MHRTRATLRDLTYNRAAHMTESRMAYACLRAVCKKYTDLSRGTGLCGPNDKDKVRIQTFSIAARARTCSRSQTIAYSG